MSNHPEEILNIAQDLINKAKDSGADHAEAVIIQSTDSGVEVRNGKVDNSDYSDSLGIGIRVLQGKQSATVSGSDLSPKGLKALLDRAIETAHFIPEDPYCAIAPENLLEKNPQYDLGCYDETDPSLDQLIDIAKTAEDVALTEEGITNSEGGNCSFGRYTVGLVTTNGFSGLYRKTLFGVSCCVLAGEGTAMERDYAYSTKTHFNMLEPAHIIGQKAAQRTLKRLHPQKMKSGNFPIIFEDRAGRSLLGHFASAISADRIARKTSFLGNKIGEKIFSSNIHIIDDPHMKSAIASCPFDMEGVVNPALNIVQDGTLNHLLVHGASARQLNIDNNGRAKRSISASPFPASTNMYMKAGTIPPEELYQDIDYGLFVTDTIGHGINEVTGDYSIGAAGFLIEKGKITSPVSEITIAGNLKEMFLNMTPANDLSFEARKNVPTLRIDGMTIAGN